MLVQILSAQEVLAGMFGRTTEDVQATMHGTNRIGACCRKVHGRVFPAARHFSYDRNSGDYLMKMGAYQAAKKQPEAGSARNCGVRRAMALQGIEKNREEFLVPRIAPKEIRKG